MDLTPTHEQERFTVTRTAHNTIDLFLYNRSASLTNQFRFARRLLCCLMVYCEPFLVKVSDSR